jgi:hypothetical protein
MQVPRLLVVLLGAHVVSLGWYVATLLDATPLHYRVPWVAHGAAAWLLVNSVFLVAAIRRVRSPRYGTERRAAVRFPVRGPALFGGRSAYLQDISLTGASLVAPEGTVRPGDRAILTMTTGDVELRLPSVVRSTSTLPAPRANGTGVQFGTEFDRLPVPSTARLALVLFRTGITPQLELHVIPGASPTRPREPERVPAA